MSKEVLNHLRNIEDKLAELKAEADTLLSELSDDEFYGIFDRAEAYKVTDFGFSCNRHDYTFATIVNDVAEELGEEKRDNDNCW